MICNIKRKEHQFYCLKTLISKNVCVMNNSSTNYLQQHRKKRKVRCQRNIDTKCMNITFTLCIFYIAPRIVNDINLPSILSLFHIVYFAFVQFSFSD